MTPVHQQYIAMMKTKERLRQASEQLRTLIREVQVISDLYDLEKQKYQELKQENNQMKGHQNDSAVDSQKTES